MKSFTNSAILQSLWELAEVALLNGLSREKLELSIFIHGKWYITESEIKHSSKEIIFSVKGVPNIKSVKSVENAIKDN